MSIRIDVRTSVFLNQAVQIAFKQGLAISLDCAKCGRTHRTVVFGPVGEQGRCTPTGHAYPGHIGEVQVRSKPGRGPNEVECLIPLTYEYSPVTDSKYPNRKSSAMPSWGRVSFSVSCPKCRQATECAIQSNTVRPWKCLCKCGYALYEENALYPTFTAASDA